MTAPVPVPSCISAVERGESRLCREDARQVVGNRDAGPDGRAVGFAGQVQEPPVGDAEPVEPGALAVGTVLAEGADPHPDETRVELCRADVPVLERPRAEVLADDVGD